MAYLLLNSLTVSRINYTADTMVYFWLEIYNEMKKKREPFDEEYLSKGAIKGVITGIAIGSKFGSRFGVYGIAVGAVVGGITGYVIEEMI